jgi:uncharacterized protein (DUF433 family)
MRLDPERVLRLHRQGRSPAEIAADLKLDADSIEEINRAISRSSARGIEHQFAEQRAHHRGVASSLGGGV